MRLNLCLDGTIFAGCVGLVLAILFSPVAAQPSVTTFLLNGVAAPDGNGEFLLASGPVLNNAGQLSFLAGLINTSGSGFSANRFGVFRLTGTNLVQVARGLESAPGSSDMFGSTFTSPPPMNSQGEVAFKASRNGLSGEAGVYTGTGGPLTVIADRSDTPPGETETFIIFGDPTISSSGQVAFLAGTPATGVYRGDGSSLVEIARQQDVAPDGNGVFTGFRNPAINPLGQVAFAADLSAAGASTGLFRGTEGSLTQIARDGTPAPGLGGGINGRFEEIGNEVSLNNDGQVAFVSTLSDTSGATADNIGVFRGSSELTNTLIARKGQSPSEGNGAFDNFSPVALNNFGAVAFRATLSGTNAGAIDNDGIYVGDEFNITTVLRDGTPAPNGNGTFELSSSLPILNDAGQLAFEVNFQNTSAGAGKGLYFWDKSAGLMEVARVGNAFLGSTITELRWAQRAGTGDLEHSGLNSMAQMAYSFRLADNTEGLAIWSANLNVVPTGDYDGDGDVDGNDFLQWQRGLSPNELSPVELAVWRAKYGMNVLFSDVGEMNTQNVPEPQSLVFFAMVGFLMGRRRKYYCQC